MTLRGYRPFPKDEWRAVFARRVQVLMPCFSEAAAADIADCEHLWAGAGCPEAAAEYYAMRDRLAQEELSKPRRRPLRPLSTDFGRLG